jgi:putative transposase
MGEIRVFHDEGFLCRAVSADLAGETVPLRAIIRARNRRRRELRAVLKDRQQAVETLLEIKRGEITEIENAKPPSPAKPAAPALKRYRNE